MTKSVSDPLIGKLVSHYEIVAKLGGGGMGIVYAAKDTRLGRLVALKFLPPQWSHDDSAKQRFIREAQAASSTDHRNICTIHNIETTDDGQLFIVMAHYEGETLKQRLERGALGVEEAVDIAAQIAEGLTKAHTQGVVHRDIKPGNLMVTEDAVKILDFGLAKFADSLQLTIPGSTLGTVAYMAPEQARGEEADARSDIWALGVVLFQMLTGEVPFKGAYAEAISYAIRHDPPPPLNVGGREIPEGVERVVLRALEKEPAKRFQSAREMARELRLLQGRTIPLDLRTEPLPPIKGSEPRSPRKVSRRVATVAAFLTLVAGVTVWLMWPVDGIAVAIAPVANHTGEPVLDDYRLALTETLVAELHDAPGIRVVPYIRVLEVIRPFVLSSGDVSSRQVIQAIATQTRVQFVVVPTLVNRGASWLARVEFRDVGTGTNTRTAETEALTSSLPKETSYRLMVSLAGRIQQHFGDTRPGRSHQLRAAGARLRTIDGVRSFEGGLSAYEQQEYSTALAAFRLAAKDDPRNPMPHAWLSRVLLVMGQNSEAVEAGVGAKQRASEETPRSDLLFIDATLAESRRELALAEGNYRDLTRLRKDDPSMHFELADFLRRQARNEEAVVAYHEVLRLDPGYIRPRVDLCQLYTRLDDPPLAEREAQNALAAYRSTGNRTGEAQALLCLGEALRMQAGERIPEAKRNVEAARNIFESLNQPYGLARAYQYMGIIAGYQRNYPDAVKFFDQALTRSREVGNRQLEGLELMNLGMAYERLGQRGRAVSNYKASRDLYEQMGDERRAAEQDVNLASLLIEYGGDHEEPLRRVENALATFRKHGQVNFEVVAMAVKASSYRSAGRHEEARKLLAEALTKAKERQLGDRVLSISVDITQSQLQLNEYDVARAQLEALAATEGGRSDPQVQIRLGQVYLRLGGFDVARRHLETALADVEKREILEYVPLAHAALGELAYESGKLEDARRRFDMASTLWTDELPDAASVDARCRLGLLSAQTGGLDSGRQLIETSVGQAFRMRRVDLETRCRLDLARLHLKQGRPADAVGILKQIPLARAGKIGPELRGQVHYWRSRAMDASGDRAGARTEAAFAQQLINQLQESLPPQFRDSFVSRAEIRPIVE